MTDNRTTELREMLTERGIEWTPRDSAFRKVTYWKCDDGKPVYYADATLGILCMTCTPDQAIAATLGSEREKALEKLVRIYGEISNYFCECFACCDAEFANCKYCIGLPQGGQCELGWCNDESRALGIEQPDYGGGECEPVNLQELYDRIAELEAELGSERIAELEAENERLRRAGYEIGYHDAMKSAKRGGTLTAEQVRGAVERSSKSTVMVRRVFSDATYAAIADELRKQFGGCKRVIIDVDGEQYEFGADSLIQMLEDYEDAQGMNNHMKLFGTPERAARTIAGITCDDGGCDGCTLYGANCSYDSNALLEWLNQEVDA